MTEHTYLPDKITALYARLSQDDSTDGDSTYSKCNKLKKRYDNPLDKQKIF